MSEGLLGAVESILEATQKKFYGVTIGIVTDIDDTLGQGRVKVKLPSFNENEETGWARIAQPSAGSGYGFYFMPKVDEEVLVAFEHGDLDLPYIIGRLWNLREKPPELTPRLGKSHIRTDAGHDIIFDDLLQSIEVVTSTGHKLKMEPLKIELSDKAGALKMTMNVSSQTITLQSALTLELKATNIKIQGTTVEINGAAKTDVKSGGVCTVQASLVKIN